jgi:RNA polymerase sigma-70 factor (ECF subfamily)
VLGARIARGDVAAFAAAYERYAARIHAWAAHALGAGAADDAVQEVFIRVWRKAHQFDPARGRFATWLMAIARHHILRELERRGRERLVAADDIDAAIATHADPAPGLDDRAWASEQERLLGRALAQLPVEQRRVLVLGYFLGMTQSQMSRSLDVPLGTVKKRVRLGLRKLRLALGGDAPATGHLRVVSDE